MIREIVRIIKEYAAEYKLIKGITWDKIDYTWLSGNNNPKAVEHLLEHTDKIYWFWFSRNNNGEVLE